MIPTKDYKMILENMPIVCVDGVIINEDNEYLLVRRINEPMKNVFWIPGGRLLKNETLEEGIRRKMKQELDIYVKVEKLLGFFEEFFERSSNEISSGLHVISFVFLLAIHNQSDIKLDDQSSEWKWSKKLPLKLTEKLKIIEK